MIAKKRTLLWCVMLGLCLALCACGGSTISQDPSEWQPTIANCWVCAIYGSSFQIANDIVFSATNVSVPLARVVLGIGLLFFLLKSVGSMIFQSADQMTGVLKGLFVVVIQAMFVAVMLYDGDQLLYLLRDSVIYPLGQFFMMMANAVLDCVPGAGQYFSGIQGLTPDMDGIVTNVSGTIEKIDPNKTIFGDLGIQIQYTVSRIFVALKAGTLLVLQMVANGGFVAWVLGIVAGWQTFSLMVVFPLAFVDGFLMLALYVIFLPLALALWVFPATKKYLKKLIPYMLSPFLQILFGCIIVVLLITTVQVYADIGLNGILRQSTQDANPWVVESAAAARPPIIIMVMLLITMKKMAAEIGDFAQLFGGTKTDPTLFGLIDKVKQAVKKTAQIAAEAAAAVATGGASAAGSIARRAAAEAAKKMAEEAAKKAAEAATQKPKNNSSGGTP